MQDRSFLILLVVKLAIFNFKDGMLLLNYSRPLIDRFCQVGAYVLAQQVRCFLSACMVLIYQYDGNAVFGFLCMMATFILGLCDCACRYFKAGKVENAEVQKLKYRNESTKMEVRKWKYRSEKINRTISVYYLTDS